MFNYIVFFVLTFIFLYLFFGNIKLLNKNKKLKLLLAQSEIDKNIIKNEFKINLNNNFVEFLSKSRDEAFSYIEEVQGGLSNFINELEPEINYFKEYGDIGSMAPNYYSMKKIVEEYNKLKILLPTEEVN
jgi:hypothetical protein